jgi:hypothetical protein
MILVALSKLDSDSPTSLLDEAVGEIRELPRVGKNLVMLGVPYNPGDPLRLIHTSPIREVRHHPEEGTLEFWTERFHYGLQILDMDAAGNA